MSWRIIIHTSLLFIGACITGYDLSAQQGNIWYFGEGAGLDFNSGNPEALYDGQLFGDPQNNMEFLYTEGSSVLSDSRGNLLCYSNGEKIWNRKHEVMPNGSGLAGMYSSTHSSIIVPFPASDSLLYIFTTDGLERNLENGLMYSVINMCLDNGHGDVIIGKKNIPLLENATEKLSVARHSNGVDYWLVAHAHESATFYSYHLGPDGIINTMMSTVGSVHTGSGYFSAIGQMKISTDKKRLGLVFSNVTPSVLEIFDFDNQTGIVSNVLSLETYFGEYGFEFSPDNSKIYTSSFGGINQYYLHAGDSTETDINNSKVTLESAFCIPSGIQLGPDGKVYVSRCSDYLGVINDPDSLGVACNFDPFGFKFESTEAKVSFPSFIADYEYSNLAFDCVTTQTTSELFEKEIRLYPNPANENLNISIDIESLSLESFQLTSPSGAHLEEHSMTGMSSYNLDISRLSSGVYFIILFTSDGHSVVRRFIID